MRDWQHASAAMDAQAITRRTQDMWDNMAPVHTKLIQVSIAHPSAQPGIA